jgi:hypothetical protein
MVKPSTHNSSMMLRLATDSSSPVAVLDAMMRSVAPSTPVWFTGDPAPGRASPLISPTLTRSLDRCAVTSKVRVLVRQNRGNFFHHAKMGPLVTWRLPAAKENHGSPLPSALLNQHVVAVES